MKTKYAPVKITAAILLLLVSLTAKADKAIFAGGCFWCMESDFQDMEGITDVISGFTGGESKNPSYKGDHRGHYEAVEISFDPAVISYQQLLDEYWTRVDPFDGGGQFCDRGPSYLSAIFVIDEEQRTLAEASRERVVERFEGQQVITPILPATQFWPVEEYHQDYYKKNSIRYKYYRYSCGRDQRLETIWGAR